MAWLKRRGGTWYAVWQEKGARKVRTTKIQAGGGLEQEMAQAAADAMEAAAKGRMLLAQALDAVRRAAAEAGMWHPVPTVEEYFSQFEPAGQALYRSNVKRSVSLFLDSIGDERFNRLDALRPEICRMFLERQLKRVSYASVKVYCAHIKAVFNAAVRNGVIAKSPFASIQLAKLVPPAFPRSAKRKPFTPKELHRLVTELPSPWKEMVLTSFLTGGQRLGDIACLKWSSVDFDNNCITFPTMKTGKVIEAPLLPELKAVLQSRFLPGEEYVYPVMAQRYRRSRGILSKEFMLLLKALGIANEKPAAIEGDRHRMAEKSFHSIRHSVVSMLRSSHFVSADLAREIVGHDSEAVERAYFSPSIEAKRAGLAYLSGSLQKAGRLPGGVLGMHPS